MNDRCRRFLEDPEANTAHLAECAACRALFDQLNTPVADASVDVPALPLAPWEGASHRSWPLVLTGAVAILVIAIALCAAVGISPLSALTIGLTSGAAARAWILDRAAEIRKASMPWQVAFGALFVIVNTALVLLLRRAPRGIDA
jgi:predicted anti-sigma-YlaC factor YlaD